MSDDNAPAPPLPSLAEVSAAAAMRDHLGAPPPEDADMRPGAAGLPPVAEARAYRPGPKWFRFPPETWTMIRAEYLAGATAKQLALKWGVSPTSVYRHACQDGFTKARRGEAINLEAVTRFATHAAELEARALAAARDAQWQAVVNEEEADPGEAAETLVRRAAARALGGKLEEAQALVKLAEGLARAASALPEPQDGPERDWRDAEPEVHLPRTSRADLIARLEALQPPPPA